MNYYGPNTREITKIIQKFESLTREQIIEMSEAGKARALLEVSINSSNERSKLLLAGHVATHSAFDNVSGDAMERARDNAMEALDQAVNKAMSTARGGSTTGTSMATMGPFLAAMGNAGQKAIYALIAHEVVFTDKATFRKYGEHYQSLIRPWESVFGKISE